MLTKVLWDCFWIVVSIAMSAFSGLAALGAMALNDLVGCVLWALLAATAYHLASGWLDTLHSHWRTYRAWRR